MKKQNVEVTEETMSTEQEAIKQTEALSNIMNTPIQEPPTPEAIVTYDDIDHNATVYDMLNIFNPKKSNFVTSMRAENREQKLAIMHSLTASDDEIMNIDKAINKPFFLDDFCMQVVMLPPMDKKDWKCDMSGNVIKHPTVRTTLLGHNKHGEKLMYTCTSEGIVKCIAKFVNYFGRPHTEDWTKPLPVYVYKQKTKQNFSVTLLGILTDNDVE